MTLAAHVSETRARFAEQPRLTDRTLLPFLVDQRGWAITAEPEPGLSEFRVFIDAAALAYARVAGRDPMGIPDRELAVIRDAFQAALDADERLSAAMASG